MVPTQTAGTQKFHNVQVTLLATAKKGKRYMITNKMMDKEILFNNLVSLWDICFPQT
jgi:hypothetical protein